MGFERPRDFEASISMGIVGMNPETAVKSDLFGFPVDKSTAVDLLAQEDLAVIAASERLELLMSAYQFSERQAVIAYPFSPLNIETELIPSNFRGPIATSRGSAYDRHVSEYPRCQYHLQ